MGFFSLCEDGKHHIPCNDDSDARYAKEGQQGHTGDDEQVAHLVAFPSPLLKLQREHRNLADEQVAAEEHHHQ